MAVPVPARFVALMADLPGAMAARAIEPSLAAELTTAFPPDGTMLAEVETLCRQGCAEGWLCAREAGGIRYGRVLKAGPETNFFSVDVVEMNDVRGPHHVHPHGEIDLIFPIDLAARFDGSGRGWTVYGPGSAHHPTVAGGKAIIVYFLPQGAIEFTGA
jgi:hypothetical protein